MHEKIINLHLETKVNVDLMRADGSCWITYLKVRKEGYYNTTSRPLRCHGTGLHVLAWEWANDREIPKGMTVNHRCHMKWCFNPAHLELMTYKEQAIDQRRYNGTTAKDFCDKHQVDRVRNNRGYFYCRPCTAERMRARYARKKAAKTQGE